MLDNIRILKSKNPLLWRFLMTTTQGRTVLPMILLVDFSLLMGLEFLNNTYQKSQVVQELAKTVKKNVALITTH
jgi:hypothetical protein